ncbi:hypothetical protein [Streptomyces tropicalis]|uniref:Uncharacterized protein n=1 Tax=Streptomyces tropicalis TaxID=3034234 RepID=A0ABT5ZZ27_9ACTN|nr:hypothetical protein [Streptomyces tropicalis]MDF3297646.1 hypothetical protein [Streptomyces tropicalis]
MTTAAAAPFRFFALQVARTRRLNPPPVRGAHAGPDRHTPPSREPGTDRRRVTFAGHWRRGPSEEEPRARE